MIALLKINLLLFFAAVILAGCATNEWHEANADCTSRFVAQFPPHIQTIPVQSTRAIQVPNGVVSCMTSGFGISAVTTCHQGMRTEFIPYISYTSIDLNKMQRDSLISICTQQACFDRFGNEDCKAGK